jgi:hypothetical protein
MSDTIRATIGAVLGASAAGIGASATAPESAPVLAVSAAGAGGAIGAGLHLLGRAVTAWIEADAATRRETAAALAEVRALCASVRADLDARRD